MIRTLMVLGVYSLAFMIMSCSSEPKRWYKAGATKSTYERESADCEDIVNEAPPHGSKVHNYTFESCMEGKGWVVLDKSTM